MQFDGAAIVENYPKGNKSEQKFSLRVLAFLFFLSTYKLSENVY